MVCVVKGTGTLGKLPARIHCVPLVGYDMSDILYGCRAAVQIRTSATYYENWTSVVQRTHIQTLYMLYPPPPLLVRVRALPICQILPTAVLHVPLQHGYNISSSSYNRPHDQQRSCLSRLSILPLSPDSFVAISSSFFELTHSPLPTP